MFEHGFDKVRSLVKVGLFVFWCYQIILMIIALSNAEDDAEGYWVYILGVAAVMVLSWVFSLLLLMFIDLCENVESQRRRISDINTELAYVRTAVTGNNPTVAGMQTEMVRPNPLLQGIAKDEGGWTCSQCGFRNRTGSATCRNCGTTILEGTSPNTNA
ncbi:MAG: zinc ribbon domain-containing protein [Lachnospiraceae bacterium]|nr:zinc ribbon domain-containing protein [Lachnospiraceae bacterium]